VGSVRADAVIDVGGDVPLPIVPPPASPAVSQRLFPGFTVADVDTKGARIHVLYKGSGPPLLLLHGYPETHAMWHKVATQLAERFAVVIPDLRGYGDSSKPDDGERHRNYSFRAMAEDQLKLMAHFGHERFFVVGHDRGARVAHRMCLDHPANVFKVCLMDIAPTLTMYSGANKQFAEQYVWWFFLIQRAPMPEHMIGLDAEFFLRQQLDALNGTPGAVTLDAMAEYVRCFCASSTIHAACEDYRASADIDLEMDQADDDAGRKIQVPVHLLWGKKGIVNQLWNLIDVWRDKASAPVTGKGLDCGHLLPEERPDEVLDEIVAFLEG
jgi:haloacetate dehalogenase